MHLEDALVWSRFHQIMNWLVGGWTQTPHFEFLNELLFRNIMFWQDAYLDCIFLSHFITDIQCLPSVW